MSWLFRFGLATGAVCFKSKAPVTAKTTSVDDTGARAWPRLAGSQRSAPLCQTRHRKVSCSGRAVHDSIAGAVCGVGSTDQGFRARALLREAGRAVGAARSARYRAGGKASLRQNDSSRTMLYVQQGTPPTLPPFLIGKFTGACMAPHLLLDGGRIGAPGQQRAAA